MKYIIKITLFLFSISVLGSEYTISKKVFNTHSLKPIHSSGNHRLENYFLFQVPSGPIKSLRKQIELNEGIKLRSSENSYITIIGPMEYWNKLKSKISIEEINRLALESNIQSSKFNIRCLGRGEGKFVYKGHYVYFLVVDSPELADFRHRVKESFVKHGGRRQDFIPEHFFPHITIGYTLKNFYYQHGVIKNDSSCINKVKLVP